MLKAGFEWFVAWRYLRSRGRRPSPVPLVAGIFLVLCAAFFFWMGNREPARPLFPVGMAPDWRRVHLVFARAIVVLGGGFAVFGAIRRWVSDRELAFGLLGGAKPAGIESNAPVEPPRRVSLAPVGAGLIAAGCALFVIIEVGAKGAAGTDWMSLVVRVEQVLLGSAALVLLSVLVAMRQRRALTGLVVAALLLALCGALLTWTTTQPDALRGFAVKAPLLDWRRVYLAAGLVALVGGVLTSVFAFFFLLQSVFTTISTFGVFLGTWALVIALSVMNGFEVDLRQKILGSNAHVLISKDDGAFTEWHEIEKQVGRVPGVMAHTPYVSSEVVIAANSNYSGVIIKGIDPRTVGKVTDLEKNLQKGSSLAKLWPVLPDGGPLEYTTRPDAGVGGDEVDAGDDDTPPDFSGDDDAGPVEPEEDEADEPPDFSGEGEGGEPEQQIVVDAGAPRSPFDDASPFGRPPHGGLGLPGSRDPDIIEMGIGSPTVIENSAARRPQRMDPRIANLDGILVGRELAKNLHLYIGQEVQVVSPLGQDTPTGQIPRVRNFRVAGIFFSGMYEYDTKFAYVTLPALQSFLSLGDEVNGIEIKIADHDNTRPVVRALQERLGPSYRVQDWKEINRNLFSALKLEKIAMFLVLTIIILVASFSIVSNLIMVVVEKAKEIAILKAIGASDPGVMRVFMIEGLYIGLLGTGFGIALGVATCWALERFGLPLDPDVYYIDRLPVAMDSAAIAMVAGAGIAISFIATLYPSYLAARMRPVDGLRYE